MGEKLKEILNTVIDWASHTGIRLVVAIIVLLISFRVITVIAKRIEKRLVNGKHKVDKTLSHTLLYVLKIVLKILVVLCLISYLGIDTSGITALVASLGVCVGLAVNGALSNLAGGVMLIITRPFKVDDYIEAQGYEGTVEDIRITSTRIRTVDNKVIYIPNGALSSGTIVNYSEKELRRVDLTFSIGYANDFEKAKNIIQNICDKHDLVLKDPAPFIRVNEHGASSINLTTKVWTKQEDYWTVKFDLLESVKKEFDKEGIEIPYNQLDVHVKND
ncbi:MAG: mechanosensitive ion channel [Clostridiales bacterium]|nr:mechanosensitive ion channel [Clostridiales bacterium]